MIVELPEKPDLGKLPATVRKKLAWDATAQTLTITQPLSPEEDAAVAATVVWEASQAAVRVAAERSRAEAVELLRTPSERGLDFRVPQLAVRVHGELQLFDDPEVLDYPWDLPLYQSEPTDEELGELRDGDRISEGGEIDVDEKAGKLRVTFLPDLARDLALGYTPDHLTEARLAGWLCRNVREPYIADASLRAFVAAFTGVVVSRTDLALANRQKFLLRAILERKIAGLRRVAVTQAYQTFLFGEDARERVEVGGGFEFEFHPDGYAPSRDDAEAGEFRCHYYPRVGAFDSDEERACALWLDRAAQQGRLAFWVRNLVRKPTCSFYLPTATGRFYPDFLCRLPDGRTLVVEYKGADRWDSAEPERKVANLWAELSAGRSLFVMVRDKRWDWIDAKLGGAPA